MRMLTIHRPSEPGDEDFCNAIEGELSVRPPTPCDIVYWCGCDRSHPGLNTQAYSTTLMVRDVELTYDDIVAACTDHATTWYDEPEAAARALVDDAIEIASHFPVGAVLRMMYHRDREQWHYTDDDRWLHIDDDDDD